MGLGREPCWAARMDDAGPFEAVPRERGPPPPSTPKPPAVPWWWNRVLLTLLFDPTPDFILGWTPTLGVSLSRYVGFFALPSVWLSALLIFLCRVYDVDVFLCLIAYYYFLFFHPLVLF